MWTSEPGSGADFLHRFRMSQVQSAEFWQPEAKIWENEPQTFPKIIIINDPQFFWARFLIMDFGLGF